MQRQQDLGYSHRRPDLDRIEELPTSIQASDSSGRNKSAKRIRAIQQKQSKTREQNEPRSIPSRQKLLSRINKVLEDSWLPDFIAFTVSAGLLIAIAVLLRHFDGRRQPTWSHVSLNFPISWLSTISKGCLLIPLSRSIGQLKWLWFSEQQQSLEDILTFDSASRGAIGSTRLLWLQRGRHLACLGCLAYILSIVFDPCIQNLVHYGLRAVNDPSQEAYFANNTIYNTVGPLKSSSEYYPDPVLKANIYSSLLDTSPEQRWAIPQYRCTSGDCTWEAAPTLSAGYACIDLTSQLVANCSYYEGEAGNCVTALPSGLKMIYTEPESSGTMMTLSASSPSSSPSYLPSPSLTQGVLSYFVDVQYIMANVTLPTDDAQDGMSLNRSTSFVARECLLYPCAEWIVGSVDANNYTESYPEPRSQESNETATGWCQFNVTGNDEPYISLQLPPPQNSAAFNNGTTTMGFGRNALRAIENLLSDIFMGNISLTSDELSISEGKDRVAISSDAVRSIFYGTLSRCPRGIDHLECAVRNTAQALSKSFRDSPFVTAGGYQGSNMAAGTTWVDEVSVQIEWYWLSVPVLVWLLSVILWLGHLVQSHRAKVPMWRNNPLPLLFLYRDAEDWEREGCTSSSAFTQRAAQARVQLHLAVEVA